MSIRVGRYSSGTAWISGSSKPILLGLAARVPYFHNGSASLSASPSNEVLDTRPLESSLSHSSSNGEILVLVYVDESADSDILVFGTEELIPSAQVFLTN